METSLARIKTNLAYNYLVKKPSGIIQSKSSVPAVGIIVFISYLLIVIITDYQYGASDFPTFGIDLIINLVILQFLFFPLSILAALAVQIVLKRKQMQWSDVVVTTGLVCVVNFMFFMILILLSSVSKLLFG